MPITLETLTPADKAILKDMAQDGVPFNEAMQTLQKMKMKIQSPLTSKILEIAAPSIPGAFSKAGKQIEEEKQTEKDIKAVTSKIPFVGGIIEEAVPGAKEIQKKENVLSQLKEKAGVVTSGLLPAPIESGLEKAADLKTSRGEAIKSIDDSTTFGKISVAKEEVEGVFKDVLFTLGLPVAETVGAIFNKALEVPFLPGGVLLEGQEAGVNLLASPKDVFNRIVEVTPDAAKNVLIKKGGEVLQGFNSFYEGLDPMTQQRLKESGAIVEIVGTLLGLGAVVKQPIVKESLKTITTKGEELLEGVLPKTPIVKELIIPKKVKDVSKLQEMFTPSATKKTRDIAFEEDRIIEGGDTFLGGTKKDFILPSAKDVKVAQTVEKYFGKNAHKKGATGLHKEIGSKVEEIAVSLAPKLRNIELPPSEIDDVFKQQDEIMKAMLKTDPAASSNLAAFKTAQNNFKEILKKLKQPVRNPDGTFRKATLDDLWQARKLYDSNKITKSTVKKAIESETAQPSVLLQKDIWLENRALLNDLIKKEGEKLGTDVSQAFSDMNDLYNAQSTLETNFKFVSKDKPGFIGQTLGGVVTRKNLAGTVIAGGVGYSLSN